MISRSAAAFRLHLVMRCGLFVVLVAISMPAAGEAYRHERGVIDDGEPPTAPGPATSGRNTSALSKCFLTEDSEVLFVLSTYSPPEVLEDIMDSVNDKLAHLFRRTNYGIRVDTLWQDAAGTELLSGKNIFANATVKNKKHASKSEPRVLSQLLVLFEVEEMTNSNWRAVECHVSTANITGGLPENVSCSDKSLALTYRPIPGHVLSSEYQVLAGDLVPLLHILAPNSNSRLIRNETNITFLTAADVCGRDTQPDIPEWVKDCDVSSLCSHCLPPSPPSPSHGPGPPSGEGIGIYTVGSVVLSAGVLLYLYIRRRRRRRQQRRGEHVEIGVDHTWQESWSWSGADTKRLLPDTNTSHSMPIKVWHTASEAYQADLDDVYQVSPRHSLSSTKRKPSRPRSLSKSQAKQRDGSLSDSGQQWRASIATGITDPYIHHKDKPPGKVERLCMRMSGHLEHMLTEGVITPDQYTTFVDMMLAAGKATGCHHFAQVIKDEMDVTKSILAFMRNIDSECTLSSGLDESLSAGLTSDGTDGASSVETMEMLKEAESVCMRMEPYLEELWTCGVITKYQLGAIEDFRNIGRSCDPRRGLKSLFMAVKRNDTCEQLLQLVHNGVFPEVSVSAGDVATGAAQCGSTPPAAADSGHGTPSVEPYERIAASDAHGAVPKTGTRRFNPALPAGPRESRSVPASDYGTMRQAHRHTRTLSSCCHHGCTSVGEVLVQCCGRHCNHLLHARCAPSASAAATGASASTEPLPLCSHCCSPEPVTADDVMPRATSGPGLSGNFLYRVSDL